MVRKFGSRDFTEHFIEFDFLLANLCRCKRPCRTNYTTGGGSVNDFPQRTKSDNQWRYSILYILIVAIFGYFLLRLFDIQILQGAAFQAQADDNRTRIIRDPSIRGPFTIATAIFWRKMCRPIMWWLSQAIFLLMRVIPRQSSGRFLN